MTFNYKHIIWDWNGTLINDLDLVIEAVNTTLQAHNLPEISTATYLALFDFPVILFYEKLGFDYTKCSFEDHSKEYHRAYEKGWRKCGLCEGVEAVLKKHQQAGVTQSILSASPQWMLESYIKYFSLQRCFKNLVGQQNDLAQGKIETGIKWLKQSGLKGEEIVLIGDTVHDHEVAQALGVDCILVTTGHHPRNKLEKCGVPILDSLNALL